MGNHNSTEEKDRQIEEYKKRLLECEQRMNNVGGKENHDELSDLVEVGKLVNEPDALSNPQNIGKNIGLFSRVIKMFSGKNKSKSKSKHFGKRKHRKHKTSRKRHRRSYTKK